MLILIWVYVVLIYICKQSARKLALGS